MRGPSGQARRFTRIARRGAISGSDLKAGEFKVLRTELKQDKAEKFKVAILDFTKPGCTETVLCQRDCLVVGPGGGGGEIIYSDGLLRGATKGETANGAESFLHYCGEVLLAFVSHLFVSIHLQPQATVRRNLTSIGQRNSAPQ
jgi:hypothetical protein